MYAARQALHLLPIPWLPFDDLLKAVNGFTSPQPVHSLTLATGSTNVLRLAPGGGSGVRLAPRCCCCQCAWQRPLALRSLSQPEKEQDPRAFVIYKSYRRLAPD